LEIKENEKEILIIIITTKKSKIIQAGEILIIFQIGEKLLVMRKNQNQKLIVGVQKLLLGEKLLQKRSKNQKSIAGEQKLQLHLGENPHQIIMLQLHGEIQEEIQLGIQVQTMIIQVEKLVDIAKNQDINFLIVQRK